MEYKQVRVLHNRQAIAGTQAVSHGCPELYVRFRGWFLRELYISDGEKQLRAHTGSPALIEMLCKTGCGDGWERTYSSRPSRIQRTLTSLLIQRAQGERLLERMHLLFVSLPGRSRRAGGRRRFQAVRCESTTRRFPYRKRRYKVLNGRDEQQDLATTVRRRLFVSI